MAAPERPASSIAATSAAEPSMNPPDASCEEISDSISLRSSGSFAQATSRNSRRSSGGRSMAV